jgi:hypothetical protein
MFLKCGRCSPYHVYLWFLSGLVLIGCLAQGRSGIGKRSSSGLQEKYGNETWKVHTRTNPKRGHTQIHHDCHAVCQEISRENAKPSGQLGLSRRQVNFGERQRQSKVKDKLGGDLLQRVVLRPRHSHSSAEYRTTQLSRPEVPAWNLLRNPIRYGSQTPAAKYCPSSPPPRHGAPSHWS